MLLLLLLPLLLLLDYCILLLLLYYYNYCYYCYCIRTGRPGSSEVPRNPLTRWDVSSIPANGIFLTKKLKEKKKAQRVEND